MERQHPLPPAGPDLDPTWVQGDLFSAPFESGSFDAVTTVAALHHVDAEAALRRFADLVRPRGVVAVIGLAANNWWDVPYAAVGAQSAFSMVHGHWKHSAPITWPPPLTYREMKGMARRVLPGAVYKRRLLGRYTVTWTKP